MYNKNRTCTIFVQKLKTLTLRLNQVSVLHVNHLTHSKNHNSSFPLLFLFSIKHFLRKQTNSTYNRTCTTVVHTSKDFEEYSCQNQKQKKIKIKIKDLDFETHKVSLIPKIIIPHFHKTFSQETNRHPKNKKAKRGKPV